MIFTKLNTLDLTRLKHTHISPCPVVSRSADTLSFEGVETLMRRPGLAGNMLMDRVVSRGVKELVICAVEYGRERMKIGQQWDIEAWT